MSAPVARCRLGTGVERLRRHLEGSGILAIPTESSYGLAADPRDAAAVAAVYRLKARAAHKPLPVVAADLGQLRDLGADLTLAERWGLPELWPAPLTVLLPVKRELAAAAGAPRVAFRIPAHAGLRELLGELGHGLTATSANASGEPPIVDPAALEVFLVGSDAMIVDGGILPGGAPSTLVEPRADALAVLRQGGFPLARLPRTPVGGETFSSDSVEILVDDSA